MNLEFGRRIKICIQLSEAKCFRHKVRLKNTPSLFICGFKSTIHVDLHQMLFLDMVM